MNYYNLLKIEPNFIPDNIIKVILQNKSINFSQASIIEEGGDNIFSDKRKTKLLNLPNKILFNLQSTIYNTHEQFFKKIYNSELVSIEGPQFLKYDIGDHYVFHNDCETFSDGKLIKNIDRDISILMYLNDDYEGGFLEFQNLGLTIKPKAGMMIAFPSYIEFTHKVHPVTFGTRYNLVSWIYTKKRIYKRPYDEDSSL